LVLGCSVGCVDGCMLSNWLGRKESFAVYFN